MKKNRKKAQREAYEKAMRAKRDARWNPDLPADELRRFREICEQMFQALESVSRPASTLCKPAHDQPPPKSHVGGPMMMLPTEDWPTDKEGEPLAAALEIYLEELPTLPDALKGYVLLQVFLQLEAGEPEPIYSGGDWCVRRIEGLQGRSPNSRGLAVDEMPLAWQLLEHDLPKYPDDLDLISDDLREEFEQLPNWSELLTDRFPSGLGTRIGGWPQWIEGSGLVGVFAFQIDGTDIEIDMSFDGALYFALEEESQIWDCAWEIG